MNTPPPRSERNTLTTPTDHEIKLVCPRCGARARMTQKAIRLSGSIRCDNDGGTFAPAAHRKYTPRRMAVASA